MSDTSTQGFGQNDQGTGDQQQQQMSDLGSDFLKGIPDADRPFVEKYVKDWDSNVTKRFQGIHEEYAPYKQLGDVDALQQAVAIARMLDDDPEQIYNALAEALGKSAPEPAQNGNQNQQQQQPNQPLQVPQEFNQFLSPLQDRLEQQNKMLEQLAQIVVQTNQRDRDTQEDAQLDSFLGQLKEKHQVEFDEQSVLLQMYNGVDPDQAVENWKNSVLESAKALGITTYSGPNPPPPLVSGSIPDSGTSVNDMDRKGVQGLVAGIMAATHQQSQ